MSKKKEEQKVIKSIRSCESFADVKNYITNLTEERITSMIDKFLLKGGTYPQLVKSIAGENKRIGSNDFKNKSRIQGHISYRKRTNHWTFTEKEDKVQLTGFEKPAE